MGITIAVSAYFQSGEWRQNGGGLMGQVRKPWADAVIEDSLWKQVLTWEGEPILALSLRYPTFAEDSPGQRRVGRYYRQVVEHWRARWEGTFFQQACAAAAVARAASRPFHCWEATLDYTITYQTDDLFSLYLDACEHTGGQQSLSVRQGDVWAMPSGTPRSLRSFFPPNCRWKAQVLTQATQQIEELLTTGDYQFEENWRKKLVVTFDPARFYLEARGIILFYPLYAIAPHVEGIPTFLITPPTSLPILPEEYH